MGINRASYWIIFSEEIKLSVYLSYQKKNLKKNLYWPESYTQTIFQIFKENTNSGFRRVFQSSYKELCTDYATKKQNMFSLGTTINGNLTGLICLETTDSIKLWIMRHQLCPVYFRHNYGFKNQNAIADGKCSSL
jgi:hypothetical protein